MALCVTLLMTIDDLTELFFFSFNFHSFQIQPMHSNKFREQCTGYRGPGKSGQDFSWLKKDSAFVD